jgi:hypothetical protein
VMVPVVMSINSWGTPLLVLPVLIRINNGQGTIALL